MQLIKEKPKVTHEYIANKTQYSRSHITNILNNNRPVLIKDLAKIIKCMENLEEFKPMLETFLNISISESHWALDILSILDNLERVRGLANKNKKGLAIILGKIIYFCINALAKICDEEAWNMNVFIKNEEESGKSLELNLQAIKNTGDDMND